MEDHNAPMETEDGGEKHLSLFIYLFYLCDTLLEYSPPPAILVCATEDDVCVQSTVQHDTVMEETGMFH